MIFSELYSAYYNAVSAILKQSLRNPISDIDLRKLSDKYAFGESIMTIPDALKDERWQLRRKDGTTVLHNSPRMPMTTLQKRWLKSISLDPRLKLFGELDIDLDGVDPLFTPDDVCIFDKYLDGDNYEDENYIHNFKRILDAVKNRYPIKIVTFNRRGEQYSRVVQPDYIEYSEKDDKFRVIGRGTKMGSTINIGRIISCTPYQGEGKRCLESRNKVTLRSVILELTDRRNALERVLLHFAHFEKQAEKLEDNRYKVIVYYEKEDETEIVIRVLSFGPMVKVVAPNHFIELVKQRLMEQKSCEH